MAENKESKAEFPCTNFAMELDASFQVCGSCGWSKDQHRPLIRKRLRKEAARSRKQKAVLTEIKTVEKAQMPCPTYSRSIHAVEYDTCNCGWSLEEHRKAERERKRLEKEEEERRQAEANMKTSREIAVEQGIACDKFEVDVENQIGGYGVCLCGKTREEHFEFKSDGENYMKIKRRLTEPKPFPEF